MLGILQLGVMVGFSESLYSVTESVGTASVCIDIIELPQRNVVVNIVRADAESQDFQLPEETALVFQPQQSQNCAQITITDDAIVEGQETFVLEVSSTDPAVDIIAMRTSLTISDNDSKPFDRNFIVMIQFQHTVNNNNITVRCCSG